MSSDEYKLQKWTQLFHFLDTNHDGVLTMGELMEFSIELLKVGKVQAAVDVARLYKDHWDAVLKVIGKEPHLLAIGQDDWVKGQMIVGDTARWRDTIMVGLSKSFFDSMDTSGDNRISMNEWRDYYRRQGANEKYIQTTFAKMDRSGEGFISREEFEYASSVWANTDIPGEDYSFLYCNPKPSIA